MTQTIEAPEKASKPEEDQGKEPAQQQGIIEQVVSAILGGDDRRYRGDDYAVIPGLDEMYAG